MADAAYAPRLKEYYETVLREELTKQFDYKNIMQVPRLDKVVINMGVGAGVADSKKVRTAADELALIAGQKPVITKARKSIATFKLREGVPIGAKVTLRKGRMYDFIDRLITIALPRVRDFRGLSPKSFDGRGNYALGIKEHIIFPEIDYDKVDEILGLDVVVCTTAANDDEARALLKGFNFPFQEAAPAQPAAEAAPEVAETDEAEATNKETANDEAADQTDQTDAVGEQAEDTDAAGETPDAPSEEK